MCRAKNKGKLCSVLRIRHRELVRGDLPQHFLPKSFHKKIE